MRLRLLAVILGLGVIVYAQTTPNINFNIPAHGTKNWDVLINSNFSLLDSYLSGHGALPGNLFNVATNITDTNTTHTLFSTGNPSIYISRAITVSDLPSIIPTTSAGIVALFSGCSGSLYLGADGACHNGLIPAGTIGFGLAYSSSSAVAAVPTSINTSAIAGADIVAKATAAFAISNDVFIPAGTYATTCTTSWTNTSGFNQYVGIVLPTGAHLHGAGMGTTIINVSRASGLTAPSCALIANANPVGSGNNPDITIDNLTINWIETGCTTLGGCNHDTAAIEMMGADRFTMHHVELQGQPNRLLNLIDTTRVSIHDNKFLLNTPTANNPSTVFGNSAIGASRYQAGIAYSLNAGKIYNNEIDETGAPSNVSLLVPTQSNLTIGPDNVFDMMHYVTSPSPSAILGQAIESGTDNLTGIEGYLLIHGNYFYGAEVRLSINDTEFSGNFLQQGRVYGYSSNGGPPSTARLKVQTNTFHCYGSGGDQCGIYIAGLSAQGFPFVTISENTIEDGSIGVYSDNVSTDGGGSNCVIENNKVYNAPNVSFAGVTPSGAILGNGCSAIRGNLVKNYNADNFSAATDSTHYGISAGDASSTVPTVISDFSGNQVIDDQVVYSTGNVCSVSSPSSTTCLSAGSSTYLYSAGATWSPGWSNRYIFVGGTPYMIKQFYAPHYIELQYSTAFIASTAYTLNYSFYNGYNLGTNIIRFDSNYCYIAANPYGRGYPSGGCITDVGGKTIQNGPTNNHFITPRQYVGGTNYNNYNQSPQVASSITCTQATCATSPTALYTMPDITTGSGGVSGVLFKIEADVACTTTVSTATATLQIGYTDVSGTAQTATATAATCTTLGASSVASFGTNVMMYGNAGSGQSVLTYKITQANSPQFQARIVVNQLTSK